MGTLGFFIRKFLYGIVLVFGVTLISFILMVYFGPEKTYSLLGKNPTAQDIVEIRHQLGYDRSFPIRYGEYLFNLLTLDLGHSDSSGEKVVSIFSRTIPITLALELPGFILGNLFALAVALFAALFRGKWPDKMIMLGAVVGMSISFLIVVIGFQVIFCSGYGLNWFPARGWEVKGVRDYIYFVTVPTLCTVFVALGYNTRFYRAIMVEEVERDYVRTARAFGCSPFIILFKYVLKNCMIPVITRIVFTVPFLVVGGSILIEKYFGIPGIGLVAYDAITSGDQPVLMALVGLTAALYVIALMLTDILYKMVDPRITIR